MAASRARPACGVGGGRRGKQKQMGRGPSKEDLESAKPLEKQKGSQGKK